MTAPIYTDPTKPTSGTSTVQPVQKPQPPTTAPTIQPVQSAPAIPQGSAIASPTAPHPLTTSDPLAFQSPAQSSTSSASGAPTPLAPGVPTTGSVAPGSTYTPGPGQPSFQPGTVPGYNGGYDYSYQSEFPTLDFSKYAGTPTTFQDLIDQGVMTPDQVWQGFGVNANDPSVQQNWRNQYNQLNGAGFTTPGGMAANLPTLSFDDWMKRYTELGDQVAALAPKDQAGVQQAMANLPHPDNSGTSTAPPVYLTGGQEVDASGNPVPGGYNALSDVYRQLGITPGTVNPTIERLVQQNPNLIAGLDPAARGTLMNTLQSLGITLPATTGGATSGVRNLAPGAASDVAPNTGAASTLPGGTGRSLTPGAANDAGTPSTGVGATLGQAISGTPVGSSFAPGVNLTPTTVDNALTNDTISPGPMADRFKIAQDQWQNFVNATDPQYQAALRDAQSRAFGAGRGVSGALRTSLGDLANQRALALDTQKNSFLNNALSGSIEDAYRNLGIAQQQQAFQAGQQGTAFNQSLQQLLAGSQGDPSQIAMMLAGIFGGQGNSVSQALANYGAQTTANNNNANLMTYLYPYLYPGADTSQTDPILQQGIPGVQTTPGGGY